MLTEGWDANTVTHVLGVRAFGTQLLCEQVIGRAPAPPVLRPERRRACSTSNMPTSSASPSTSPPSRSSLRRAKPRETIRVQAVRPERDALEIRFPRVEGYRVELPDERLKPSSTTNSVLELTPDIVGPSITKNSGIIGEARGPRPSSTSDDMRASTILFHLAQAPALHKYRDPGEEPKLHLFAQMKRITGSGSTAATSAASAAPIPAQLSTANSPTWRANASRRPSPRTLAGERPVKAILDPYNPTGTTGFVNFTTSKAAAGRPSHDRCHINWVVCDSDWEAEFCRVAEVQPRVLAYVKNQGLGFEVPYLMGVDAAPLSAGLHRASRRRPRTTR